MPTVQSVPWFSFTQHGVSFLQTLLLISTHCHEPFPQCTSLHLMLLSIAGCQKKHIVHMFLYMCMSNLVIYDRSVGISVGVLHGYDYILLFSQSVNSVWNGGCPQYTFVSRCQTNGQIQPNRKNVRNSYIVHNQPDRCLIHFCINQKWSQFYFMSTRKITAVFCF